MWDLENEENYILTLDGHSGYDSNETITCIHFCEKKGKKFILIFEPQHEISKNVVCATSKASDQPTHTRSLIRAFASRLNIL